MHIVSLIYIHARQFNEYISSYQFDVHMRSLFSSHLFMERIVMSRGLSGCSICM